MKKVLIIVMLLFPIISAGEGIENYLIQNNIDEYIFRPKRVITIGNAGVLVPTGHFPGHGDMTYEGIYIHPQTYLGVKVQVTQHAGSDSDRWLLHEVESSFRGREKEGWFGQSLYESASIRVIDGNKILDYGNIDYRWISNNVVVYIHYTDLTGTKPEPLEIVQAYLRKFPSTITLTDTEIKSKAHNEKWIKDEMDRRLWLCDKWFMALQLGKAKLDKVLKESVDHMNVFLDYREKYYGVSARKEKGVLWEYLKAKDGTAIKNKLTEYKSWWEANKDKAINL